MELPTRDDPTRARTPAALSRAARGLLLAQACAGAVLVSWPLLPRLATEAVGSAATDTPKHLWTLWWMRRELLDGVPGLRTTWVDYPTGMEIYPISPLDGLLNALVPAPPLLASNLLALLHLVLLGVAGSWLGWEVARGRAAAHAAGALAQAAAFTGFALEVGVGELRLGWWLPVGLALLVRARRSGAPRDFAALGLALAGAMLSCFYHGFFLAFATVAWALATLRPRPRLLRGYALAAALALLVVVPVVRAFSASYADVGAQTLFPGASAGLDELYAPARLFPAMSGLAASGYGGGRYLGVGASLLALLGVAARPRFGLPWATVLAGSVLLALGPVLTRGGEVLPVGGARIVLPMAWVNAALAHLGEPLNFPARFLALAGVCIAVLGALAVARWPRAAWLVPLAVADLLVNDRAAWPRATMALPDMDGLTAAASDGATGGVADLSMVASSAEPAVRTRAIAAQLALGAPFATVPVERLSRWGDHGERWLRALPLVAHLIHIERRGMVARDADWRSDLWLLRDQGYDRLLFTHAQTTADVRADQLLTALCGAPARARHGTLWRIPVVSATAAEATEWRAAQARRLASGP